MARDLVWLAGETSGDFIASLVLPQVAHRYPDEKMYGIGGDRMIAAGLDAWHHSRALSVRGYVEVIKKLPSLLKLRSEMKRRVSQLAPRAFIGVDAPDFNLAIEEYLRREGIKTIHFVCPSIWAWRPERIHQIKRAVDHMLLIFPFEKKLMDEAGIKSTYIGHPLAREIPMEPDKDAAREKLGIDPTGPVFAVLPGSRQAEVAWCGPHFFGACEKVLEFDKRSLFLVPAADRARESQIKEVRDITFEILQSAQSNSAKKGQIKKYNIIPDYIKEMKEKFGNVGRGVKVVVDSANATGGIVGPELYREIGCDVVELFSEPDGNFPNHHPNPSVEKTLDILKETVIKEKADIGIAYDGDSDRIGVVDNKGRYLTGDKLLLIYALDLIADCKKKGITPKIVSEVKCSQVLYDTINNCGGEAIMCKTGHGYIKGKMKETGAILAGEMSGHTFFKDRYYGFDDAIYAGCRIIEIISKHKAIKPDFTIHEMLEPFDKVFTSSEVRFPCPNELKKSTLIEIQQIVENNRDIFGSPIKDIITLDGMRIVFDGGFALIRQSNTEPVFTLRFEAKTKEECERFQNCMTGLLEKILDKAKV